MTEETDLRDAGRYRHWATDMVRFSDQDGMGHVNNVAIAAYAETGRLLFDREVIRPVLEGRSWLILASLRVDYLKETNWPGEVRIGTRLLRLGRTSLTVGSGLFRDGACFATSTAIMVNLLDGSSAPFADDVRPALERLVAEGG